MIKKFLKVLAFAVGIVLVAIFAVAVQDPLGIPDVLNEGPIKAIGYFFLGFLILFVGEWIVDFFRGFPKKGKEKSFKEKK